MEMKLTYIAIHTAKPERMKDFYVNNSDYLKKAQKYGQITG